MPDLTDPRILNACTIASTLVQGATLGVLWWYACLTRTIAKATEQNTRILKDSEEARRFPLVTFELCNYEAPQSWEQIITLFRVHNRSDYDAKVFTHCTVKFQEDEINWDVLGDLTYSGRKPWMIPAQVTHQENVDFGRVVPEDFKRLPSREQNRGRKDLLTFSMFYKWTDSEGTKTKTSMVQKWYYEFGISKWVLDI